MTASPTLLAPALPRRAGRGDSGRGGPIPASRRGRGRPHPRRAQDAERRRRPRRACSPPSSARPPTQALDAINAARRSVGRARDLDILPGVLARLKAPPEARDVLLARHRRAAGGGAPRPSRDRRRRRRRGAARAGALGRGLGRRGGGRRAAARSRCGEPIARRGGSATRRWRAATPAICTPCACASSIFPSARACSSRRGRRCFRRWMRELHRLRTALGDHNDLTVLAEFARGRPELPPRASQGPARADRAATPAAWSVAPASSSRRLFSERPGAFERRIAAYLERPQQKPTRARATADPSPQG